MILPDLNILVYAYCSELPQHAAAKQWWEQALNDQNESIRLAWVVVLGFVRVTTNPRTLTAPVPLSRATQAVRSWLALPHVQVATPGPDHAERLFELLESVGVGGNLTTDAHLAVLAREYRAEVATTDADFARFPGVRHFNPLRRKRSRD